MELGEISTAVATVKLYLAQDLRIIKFLAETTITVLDKAGSKNNSVGYFQKFFFIAAFRAGDPLGAGKSYHFRSSFFFIELGRIRITHCQGQASF